MKARDGKAVLSAQEEQEINETLDKCYAAAVEDASRAANISSLGLQSLVKIVFHRHVLNQRRDWASSRVCSYPGCERKTKIRSHTIQREGALRLIAENGHVLSPRVNILNGALEMESLGLKAASTFTGFCEVHEQTFGFERQKSLITAEDHELQIFRTVCRELRNLQHQIISSKGLLILYKKRKTVEMIIRMMDKLGESFFEKYGVRRIAFQFDADNYVTQTLAKQVDDSQRIYNRVLSTFYRSFHLQPGGKLNAPNLRSFLLSLPFQLPVALAGRSGFSVIENEIHRNVDVILNVTPCANQTFCSITCTECDADLVERFVAMYRTDLEWLSLVESWMIHCSDHWFIKPSIWRAVPRQRRAKLCEMIRTSESHIGEKCALSIFDGIRCRLIAENQPGTEECLTVFAKSLIDNESAKLQM